MGRSKVTLTESGQEIFVYSCHGDEVTKVPRNAKLIMTSDYCPI